jgi:hypothetical protein
VQIPDRLMALPRSRLSRLAKANTNTNYDHGGIIGNSKVEVIAHTSFSGCGSQKMKRERPASATLSRNNVMSPRRLISWKKFLWRGRIGRQPSYFHRAIGGTDRSIQIEKIIRSRSKPATGPNENQRRPCASHRK